ncbi:PucR family transcriptional regulator [Agromyces badenianii]|uniref:PucR family transcriptional regulator n=1 Tax=Agromyces badenianii TaxID=2080742 RepID=A0A2S0WTN5_9MICO|nr:PucR family transcriptional regulator [Agromyces badenianii]AWB94697.1 PucR family transcriptional regulator [Agromyces badenianii]
MDEVISPTPPLRSAAPPVTLGELIEQLGPRTIASIGAPGTRVAVTGTEFLDIADEVPDAPGTLLLAPSTASLSTARLAAVAAGAAERGAAGLAVKCSSDRIPALAAIAESSGLPLLRVADRISWRLLDAQLTHLLGEAEAPLAGPQDRGAEPLFALANELAEFFGGSVAIEDLSRNILAYSSVPGQLIDALRTHGILARQVPASPYNDDQYRTVLRSEGAIKYPRLGEEEPRVAVAIKAGALPLGSIWAIDAAGEGPVTPEQDERMRRASALAGAHLLDDLRAHSTNQRPREDRLRTLLTGIDLTGTEFAELGIPEERGAVLLGFDVPGAGPTAIAQLRSTVIRHLVLHRPDAVAVAHRGRVYTLFAAGDVDEAVTVARPLLPLIDRLVGEGTRVAVAGPTHRSGDVAGARELADRLLGAAARGAGSSMPRIVTAANVRPSLVVERVAELFAAAAELRDPALDALSEAEGTRPIVETLLVWLECFGNVAQTAERLDVHQNTVRHRLRRASETHGIKLELADERLAAWLQLRANAP